MTVIIILFIGRWSSVVNVKNRERRSAARGQIVEFGSGKVGKKNSEFGMRKSEFEIDGFLLDGDDFTIIKIKICLN